MSLGCVESLAVRFFALFELRAFAKYRKAMQAIGNELGLTNSPDILNDRTSFEKIHDDSRTELLRLDILKRLVLKQDSPNLTVRRSIASVSVGLPVLSTEDSQIGLSWQAKRLRPRLQSTIKNRRYLFNLVKLHCLELTREMTGPGILQLAALSIKLIY